MCCLSLMYVFISGNCVAAYSGLPAPAHSAYDVSSCYEYFRMFAAKI